MSLKKSISKNKNQKNNTKLKKKERNNKSELSSLDENPIIEPIYGIIKLAMVGLYPEGTKIAFSDNTLYFRENTFYQAIARWSSKESRKQLNYFYPCIVKSLQFFNQRIVSVDYILKLLIDSVEKLRKIYTEDSFFLVYLNKIIKVVENYQKQKQLTLSHSYYVNNYPESINLSMHSELWSTMEIDFLNDSLKTMYLHKHNLLRTSDTLGENYLKTNLDFLNQFLEEKKTQFQKIIV